MDKIKTIIVGLLKFIRALIIVFIVLALIYFGIDYVFKDILPYISRSVLSNFVVFAIVIFCAAKYAVHPVKALEDAQQAVTDSIMESESVKVKSEERLSSIEESINHIEEDIDAILDKSEENARLVGEKVVQDGKKTALVIQENTGKAV